MNPLHAESAIDFSLPTYGKWIIIWCLTSSTRTMETSVWPNVAPQNIIVRMPNWLGDVVMGTPLLQMLRKAYPRARITAMCQTNVCALMTHDPNLDEIFCYQRPSGWIHRRQHLKIISPLRKGNFDLGILLTNSFSSAWWFWRGNVKNRLGFSCGMRNLLLDKAVPFPINREHMHLVHTYQALLQPLQIPLSPTAPQLYLTKEEVLQAKQLLKRYHIECGKHTLIGINPGAAYGSAKCWLPERFEEVTRRLLEKSKCHVVYFGDTAGAALCKKICAGFPERVVNLAGKTSIRELMALISCCSLVLTNDSGPMHIAAALRVPLLALFGSTSSTKTGPFPEGRVIQKHVPCSPCYKRVCPIDFPCMKQITAEEVYCQIMDLLKPSSKSSVQMLKTPANQDGQKTRL